MSELTVSLVKGYNFGPTEKITPEKLNLMAAPSVNLDGLVGTASIGAGAVGTTNLADLCVATGKLAAAAVTAPKVADDAILPRAVDDSVGLAPADLGVDVVMKYASVSTVDIDATELVLKYVDSGAARKLMLYGVNLTVDMATVGAINGLDVGPEVANSWYYMWVISDGTNVAGLASLSATAPTLPAGYTYKALVGAIQNGAGGSGTDFIRTLAWNKRHWMARQTIFTARTAPADWTSISALTGSPTPLTKYQRAVPPEARMVRGIVSVSQAGGLYLAADANGVGEGALYATSPSVTSNFAIPSIPAAGADLFWKGTSTGCDLHVIGFDL